MKKHKTHSNSRAAFLSIFLVVAACFIVNLSATAAYARDAAPDYKPYFKDFPVFVERLLSEWHVPGTVIGVVKDGKIIYLEGFGFRDIENQLTVNGRTLFCICSCTKAFTSFAAAQLVADGKLDWDTPIIRYLPDFALYDPYAARQATMRDLLSHRTGVAQHDLMWKKSPFTRAEMFKRLRYLQPTQKFRASYLYNNYMYMAAGHIVGRISGQTWERFVSKRILEPLGMKRTYFSIGQAESDPNFAHPYRFDGKKFHRCQYYNMETIAPAGGMTTSAENMCKWMIMHLEGNWGQAS
jgi:CubicO group peptidase (beta-lactamase class C family)